MNDIIIGNNDTVSNGMGYTAGAGWDACTGTGAPIGDKLYLALT